MGLRNKSEGGASAGGDLSLDFVVFMGIFSRKLAGFVPIQDRFMLLPHSILNVD